MLHLNDINLVWGEQNSPSWALEMGRPKMGTWPLRAYSHPAADSELYQRHKWLFNSCRPAKIRSDSSIPCCWGTRCCCWGTRCSLTHLKVDEGISHFILSSVGWQRGLRKTYGWATRPDDSKLKGSLRIFGMSAINLTWKPAHFIMHSYNTMMWAVF